jgi:hypothetical protein
MAYARQFENDIFISYAHVDNEDPMGVGWVKLFRDCLEARLKQLIGDRTGTRALAIWRDKKLDGNERFAEVLVDEVRKAALMVSVRSPSYGAARRSRPSATPPAARAACTSAPTRRASSRC